MQYMTQRSAQATARWILLIGGAVVVVLLATGAFYLIGPSVTVTEVVQGPVVESFYATGTIEPSTEYPIRTGTAGLLIDVRVDKGDHVKKGQAIAVVSDPQLQLALDKAKASLDEATRRADEHISPVLAEFDAKTQAMQAMLDNANREEKSLEQVAATGASSRTDRDRAADRVKEHWSELESLKAQRAQMVLQLDNDLEVARAGVRAAQTDFDRQTLTSPVDGVVLDRPQPRGTRLALNDHIMQIADVRPANLVMRAAVDEENVAQVQTGQKVLVTLYSFPNQTFEASVSKLYDKAEPDRRTFEVDVKLAEPDPKLAAGMTGELAFVIAAKEQAPIIPSQAVQAGHVYTVHDGRLALADVKTGLKSVERVEILSGLSPGEPVVISPIALKDVGRRVRIARMDPKAAADLNTPPQREVFKGFN